MNGPCQPRPRRSFSWNEDIFDKEEPLSLSLRATKLTEIYTDEVFAVHRGDPASAVAQSDAARKAIATWEQAGDAVRANAARARLALFKQDEPFRE